MNGLSFTVFLKNQYAGTFRKIRIIFKDDTVSNVCDNISN
ncbi:MAG: hypothetical protein MHPDNHAH_01518 [Anaerolineales bacterium]|nr:hypothetical protein [Anaerolineales bacterium]